MQKRKVLFVMESLSGGGAEMVLHTLVKKFDYSKYDVTVCSLVDVGKYNESIKNTCHYTYVIPDATGRSVLFRLWCSLLYHFIYFWLPMKWVYRLFLPKGFDTEVAFIEGFVTKLLQYSPKHKVAWMHCDLKEYPWPVSTGIYKDKAEEQAAYATYDGIAVVSESSKQHFVELYGLADRTCCIYNPIDRSLIRELASFGKRDTADTRFRFVTVGRLMQAKGYDRLVEASARLKKEGYDFDLWIIGEGADRNALETQVKESGLSENVKFLGFQTNPHMYLNQCDCFVCSSRTEGYSLVIAEAMCVGLPVISTRCAGPEEILEGGKYGLMVDNSTDGLYEGMKAILGKKDLSDMVALSKQRAQAFDLNKTMNDVYNIIE